MSTHLSQASHLLEDQARVTQRTMLESLKRHRDLLVSTQELLQRRDQSRDGNTVEMLKKRISANEAKLKTLKTSAATAAAATTGDSSSVGLYDAQIEKFTNNINSVCMVYLLHCMHVHIFFRRNINIPDIFAIMC